MKHISEPGSSGESLEHLLTQNATAVRRRISREMPRRFQAVLTLDDVMQESYTDAFLDFDGFESRDDGAFLRWLTTIAMNNLRNAIEGLEAKKRGGDRRQIELGQPDDSRVVLCELLGTTQGTPSKMAALGEACSALDQAIERLPEDYRHVVRLYDLENRPVEEVAEALNRRSGAVFMLRARAHRALRQLMGDRSKYFSSSP